MHVLDTIGHGFSQRRRTAKPKDLHIRKVSLSGCSLTSACSESSSSSSSSTIRAPLSVRTLSSPGFDPLNLNPTFQAPPRLHERALISPEQGPYSTFSDMFDDEYTVCSAQELHFSHPKEMAMPPNASPRIHDPEASEFEDYFMMAEIPKRPAMLRSKWSESTIQTLDITPDDSLNGGTPDTEAEEEVAAMTAEEEDSSSLDIPNFSHKRPVPPTRPPMRSLDSLEDFIKKGGWKRRGVVFSANEENRRRTEC